MTIQQILLAHGAIAPVDAADFDGTNDYATRGAGLTNAVDSKQMTFVMWQKRDTSQGPYLCGSTDSNPPIECLIAPSGANKLEIIVKNAASTNILSIVSTTTTSTSAWQCWMVSVDLADAAKRFIYLGDTSDLGTVTAYTNDTMDFTPSNWSIGAYPDGALKYDGGIAEMYLWTGVYTDFSVTANRRMFIDALGKPVGSATAIATLGAPDIYFHLNDGETANNFVLNNDGGDGGAFTVTGALSTYATSPSD